MSHFNSTQQGRFYSSTTSISGIEVCNYIAAANPDAAVCALSLLLQFLLMSLC
jgi:hypothetical protein